MRSHSTRCIFLVGALIIIPSAQAFTQNAFDTVTKHLKDRYSARERHIPFMGLARFGVKLIRPAGVKSIEVKIFENLQPHQDCADLAGAQLNSTLESSLGSDWSPIIKVYSRRSLEQTFVYAKEDGKDLKLFVVALDHDQATIARLTLSPEGVVKFMNNPKILGVSLGKPD
jgi:hypothetical protein